MKSVAALWVLGALCGSACGTASPPGPREGALSVVVSARDTAARDVEPSPPPDAIRCGVDDEPVPVGELLPAPPRHIARSNALAIEVDTSEPAGQQPSPAQAARHRGTTKWTLPPSVHAPPLFGERVDACGQEIDANDGGSARVELRFATSGTVLWVRPLTPARSKVAACLVRTACLLEDGKRDRARSLEAAYEVKAEAPSFLGKVSVEIGGRLGEVVGRIQGRPPPASFTSYAAKVSRAAEEATSWCVRAQPPLATFVLAVSVGLDDAGRPSPATAAATRTSYADGIARCVHAKLASALPPAPRGAVPDHDLQLVLRVTNPEDVPGQL